MPNHISEDRVQNFLSRNTVALSLSSIPVDSMHCPICRDPYSAQNESDLHPSIGPDTPEYPVQITRCGPCEHIFGRRCIERSIRAGQPWSHVCPECRQQWFVPPNSTRTEIMADIASGLNVLARLGRADIDEPTGGALDDVERVLERLQERLLDRRWI